MTMSHLNWVDWLILLIFFFSIIAGLMRGFVKEVISLITLIAAFVIAAMFSNVLAEVFTRQESVQNAITQATSSMGVDATAPVSYLAIAVSFGLIFAAVIITGAIIGYFINLAFRTGVLGFGNRIFGAAFGLVRGFLINLVLIFIIQLTPLISQPWWVQSQFVNAYQPAVQWLGSIVSPKLANLKARFEQTIQNVGSQIQGLNNYYTGFRR